MDFTLSKIEVNMKFPITKRKRFKLVKSLKLWNFILEKKLDFIIVCIFTYLSVVSFLYFFQTDLQLSYNDAMSHLNIARRVFDNLQPGLAQLGSVWLPLPHMLMLPTIWSNFMWQTGISAAIISMGSYIAACYAVYKTVNLLTDRVLAGLIASLVIGSNLNFLYIQTTALTEPLFIGLFSLSMYFLVKWSRFGNPINLVLLGVCTLLMTLTRYDAWFTFPFLALAIFVIAYIKKGYKAAEGLTILFSTLGAFGMFLWILYNFVIFKDAFYFALGEYSAKAQQSMLLEAGVLPTKYNLFLSLKTYYYAIADNVGIFIICLAVVGFIYFVVKTKGWIPKIIALTLISAVLFNVIALYLGFSVIFVPEMAGNSWFNVRYGLIALPVLAIFIGYMIGSREKSFILFVPILLIMQTIIFYQSNYSATIFDGVIGSSQKNVKPIGSVIHRLYTDDKGYILVSAASHDAILFSSGINLNQFIHEGVQQYWNSALANPEIYAKYIIMRTNDKQDSVSRSIMNIKDFSNKYDLVYKGDYADIYKKHSAKL